MAKSGHTHQAKLASDRLLTMLAIYYKYKCVRVPVVSACRFITCPLRYSKELESEPISVAT